MGGWEEEEWEWGVMLHVACRMSHVACRRTGPPHVCALPQCMRLLSMPETVVGTDPNICPPLPLLHSDETGWGQCVMCDGMGCAACVVGCAACVCVMDGACVCMHGPLPLPLVHASDAKVDDDSRSADHPYARGNSAEMF